MLHEALQLFLAVRNGLADVLVTSVLSLEKSGHVSGYVVADVFLDVKFRLNSNRQQ